tara:strand:+ start:295 stop:1287 length:993 start_codon:yes stop_codon:yes gene_type:complete
MSKTLGDLAQQFAYLNVPTGTKGTKLEHIPFTREEVMELIPEEKYQRLLSASSIKKQGQMDWSLLLPMVLAIRPDSVPESERGSRVIDGQHKGVKYLQSGTTDPYTCCVLRHPVEFTLEKCEEEEAKVFTHLNTLRKKLSKLEEIRAGVVWRQPEALWVQNVLNALNLIVDGSFGSQQEDALELKGFYQFWFMTVDFPNDNSEIVKGYSLWKKLFAKRSGKKAKYVNGTALRAMVLLQEFIDTLTNGRKIKFYEFITEFLPKAVSQDGLVKPYTDRKSNRYVLYDILDRYKDYCEANTFAPAYCIGDQTIKDAIKKSSKFSDPREDKKKK